MIAVRWLIIALGLGIWPGTAFQGVCQTQSADPGRNQLRGSPAPLTALPATGPSDVAEPDTAVAWISGPANWPAPVSLAVWPDSLSFGGELTLILDFPDTGDLPADSLACAAPWWDWNTGPADDGRWHQWWRRLRRGRSDANRLPADWPAAAGVRLIRTARIYREGPIRVGWQEQTGSLTPIIHSQGRAPQDAIPVGPADPRGLGYRRWMIAGLAALAMAALYLLFWWRRRRLRPRHSLHVPIPPPAYLAAANQLWELHQQQRKGEVEGRVFLDRLAIILRRYLGGRYRIRALELTAEEIPAALSRLGYRDPHGADFASLLQRADASRYAPVSVPLDTCQQIFGQAIDLIEAVQIQARYSEVPAALAVSGQQAWSHLRNLAGERAALAGAAVSGGDRDA